jgi:DNA helicase HerA-like ATPase
MTPSARFVERYGVGPNPDSGQQPMSVGGRAALRTRAMCVPICLSLLLPPLGSGVEATVSYRDGTRRRVVTLQRGTDDRARRSQKLYGLQFARDVEVDGVFGFVASLAGAGPRSASRRGPTFVFDIEANAGGIAHRVGVDGELDDYLVAQIAAHLPRTRVTPIRHDRSDWDSVARVTRLPASNKGRVASPEATITTLLTSLAHLRSDETLLLRWVVRSSVISSRSLGARTRAPVTEEATFVANGFIAARAADLACARRLVGRALTALTSIDPAAMAFESSAGSDAMLASRHLPLQGGLRPPSNYSVRELSVLIAFPAVSAVVEGLPRSPSRQLRPDRAIPTEGLVLGMSNFAGTRRPIALAPADLLRHLWIVGSTGVGKSTLMHHVAAQLIVLGYGVAVIEPKRDLSWDIASTVPLSRRDDVAIFDPSDREFPIGLNALGGGDPEWLTAQVVGLFRLLHGDSWGPRLEFILRHAVLTAARAGLSLYDVKLLLTHERFRHGIVSSLTDGDLREFWKWYEHAPDNAADSVLNKLDGFVGYSVIRNIVGQHTTGIDIAQVVRDGQILLAPLAAGLIGDVNAAMLGSLILSRIWDAARQRAAIPARRRQPFFVLIDEFQQFAHLPVALGDALAQARGYGLGMVLANQHLAQLDTSVRAGVMANARSKIAFATGADDARALAREFAPDVDAIDLQTLGRFEAVAHLLANDAVTAPVTLDTFPRPRRTIDPAELRAASRKRFARPVADVERDLASRIERVAGSGTGPSVGREQ